MGARVTDAIVGICRFSFLGKCDWVETRRKGGGTAEVMERRRALLYTDDRLSQRFHAFESLCLPSIRAQTDPMFSMWLLTSPELPEHWRARLDDLIAGSPQIRVITSIERDAASALREPLRDAAEQAGRPVIQFRLDDDDAISRHHVARLRRQAQRFTDLPGFAISFLKGLVYGSYAGREIGYWRAHQSFVGVGAAVRMSRPERCIYELLHRRIPRHLPAFTDPTGFGYVQTRWDLGDSAPIKGNAPVENWFDEIDEATFRDCLADDFPFLATTDLSFVRAPASA